MGAMLDRLEPLLAAMPAVKGPEGHVHFKQKLMWTVGILLLYFC
jgi:protein translocase subunit secY/sec61 alpha